MPNMGCLPCLARAEEKKDFFSSIAGRLSVLLINEALLFSRIVAIVVIYHYI